jgi:hypothetical protein
MNEAQILLEFDCNATQSSKWEMMVDPLLPVKSSGCGVGLENPWPSELSAAFRIWCFESSSGLADLCRCPTTYRGCQLWAMSDVDVLMNNTYFLAPYLMCSSQLELGSAVWVATHVI